MRSLVNGIELGYDDSGGGPPVVLIHGFPLCRRMWRPQTAALTAAGYRVIAPDLRGFGESGAGTVPLEIGQMADDVVALLDRLEIERAVVGGMSMGGYVLLNLLQRHRSRLAAALLLVTRAAADDEAGRAKRTALAAEVAAGRPEVVTGAFASVLFAPATPQQRPELVAEVKGWMAATAPTGLAGGLLAMRDRRDYVDLLPAFDLPALVVGAESDLAVPPEHAHVLAQGLPQARLCLLPGAGHMANLEQPAAFNACLLEFLHDLGARGVIPSVPR
jgi:pimeloyl-ACP methyl ester carboxylesterase